MRLGKEYLSWVKLNALFLAFDDLDEDGKNPEKYRQWLKFTVISSC